MNSEEVKRVGPSYPQDIDWGFQAYRKYLDKHREYEIAEGDIPIFVVGCVSGVLSALPLGMYSPDGGIRLERVGVFNRGLSKSNSRAKVPYHGLSPHRIL